MAKLSYFEIAGKNYPLSFSLMAEKTLAGRYGSLTKMSEFIKGDDEKSLGEIAYILELLICQGCAYKNMFEQDVPIEENSPVKDGKWIPLTEEQILVGVDVTMQNDMIRAIKEAMGRGQEKDIETIEKNLEAQGEVEA